MKTYYDNRCELTKELKEVIDDYFSGLREESEFITIIKEIFINNSQLIVNNKEEYFDEFIRQLGKKRMRMFQFAIEKDAPETTEELELLLHS